MAEWITTAVNLYSVIILEPGINYVNYATNGRHHSPVCWCHV